MGFKAMKYKHLVGFAFAEMVGLLCTKYGSATVGWQFAIPPSTQKGCTIYNLKKKKSSPASICFQLYLHHTSVFVFWASAMQQGGFCII